ncbi:MAG: MFS transporter [Bacteroidales bacterium]|nr:MFS transporter [Bacteroidales bacterium]
MNQISSPAQSGKLSLGEKIAYALGDASANIAWRGVSTFLLIFYTDVFGLTAAVAGIVLLVGRFTDGIGDLLMGVVGDRTRSKYGHFRPWILWTAIPLGVTLSLIFTAPDWSQEMKGVYALVTYTLFMLIYTANNVPYGSLMAVMTPDDKERTSLSSFRMVGAFAGGMLVQGALLFLVSYFGNVNPTVNVTKMAEAQYAVTVSTTEDYQKVKISTSDAVASVEWADSLGINPAKSQNFSAVANEQYKFVVTGQTELTAEDITIIDQSRGYSNSMYIMSAILVLALLITFRFTRERVEPPADQKTDIWADLKDLIHNTPWVVLLCVGLLFNIYNNIKQGITVIYFSHYVHNEFLAATYMVCLMLASIAGAMLTTPLGIRFGKKNLFIGALLATGLINSFIYFCGPEDTTAIFAIGIGSEVFAAFLPTLFFAMLGDAADYSEYVNGRRATGLVYAAGSFATKFGGGLAGAIIGFVLSGFGYVGADPSTYAGSQEGFVMLMSWVPAIIVIAGAAIMFFYPLSQQKQSQITAELQARRAAQQAQE